MSNTVLELSELMVSCPLPWQNFVFSLPEEDKDEYNGYDDDTLNKHLARFHAKYLPATEFNESAVHFETEADFTAFRIMYG